MVKGKGRGGGKEEGRNWRAGESKELKDKGSKERGRGGRKRREEEEEGGGRGGRKQRVRGGNKE